VDLLHCRARDLAEAARVRRQREDNRERVREHKDEKRGGPQHDRLLHAAQIDQREPDDAGISHEEFPMEPRGRQDAEQRIRAARDRDRDCEHVVDQ